MPAPPVAPTVLASGSPRRALPCMGPQAQRIVVRKLTLAPGGATDWHYHQYPMLVVVSAGTLTYTDADGRQEVYPAGSTFTEHVDVVHRGRNLGTDPLVLLLVHFLPTARTPLSIAADPAAGAPRPSGAAPHRHPSGGAARRW
ncbi:cupin domain-containing protein [Kitasatospora purpeofusca]|nr:cupin domain-containing protein [Kitasatospora purpeofusca]